MTDFAERSAHFLGSDPAASDAADSDPTVQIAAVQGRSTPRATPRGAATFWARVMTPTSPALTYVGALLVVVGFGLIALAWADTARSTNVGLQMPYVVSAGLSGLGLIMVGLVMVNVAAKRQDGAERIRQMRALTETLSELQRTMERIEGDGDD